MHPIIPHRVFPAPPTASELGATLWKLGDTLSCAARLRLEQATTAASAHRVTCAIPVAFAGQESLVSHDSRSCWTAAPGNCGHTPATRPWHRISLSCYALASPRPTEARSALLGVLGLRIRVRRVELSRRCRGPQPRGHPPLCCPLQGPAGRRALATEFGSRREGRSQHPAVSSCGAHQHCDRGAEQDRPRLHPRILVPTALESKSNGGVVEERTRGGREPDAKRGVCPGQFLDLRAGRSRARIPEETRPTVSGGGDYGPGEGVISSRTSWGTRRSWGRPVSRFPTRPRRNEKTSPARGAPPHRARGCSRGPTPRTHAGSWGCPFSRPSAPARQPRDPLLPPPRTSRLRAREGKHHARALYTLVHPWSSVRTHSDMTRVASALPPVISYRFPLLEAMPSTVSSVPSSSAATGLAEDGPRTRNVASRYAPVSNVEDAPGQVVARVTSVPLASTGEGSQKGQSEMDMDTFSCPANTCRAQPTRSGIPREGGADSACFAGLVAPMQGLHSPEGVVPAGDSRQAVNLDGKPRREGPRIQPRSACAIVSGNSENGFSCAHLVFSRGERGGWERESRSRSVRRGRVRRAAPRWVRVSRVELSLSRRKNRGGTIASLPSRRKRSVLMAGLPLPLRRRS